jgi:hypothetical protein
LGAPWWERYPERYASELRELELAHIRYERDEVAFAAGFLRLRVFPVIDEEELPLVATFPELYPFFKFEVAAPTLDLLHHQHPASKTLCLLPRGTEWWRPDSDRLASLLSEQLPRMLDAAKAEDPSSFAEVEEHQGEPYSDYYSYAPESLVLVDSRWSIPAEVAPTCQHP